MLWYLARMEPYYLKCIKNGQFQPKTVEGDAKPEFQWTPDERSVVVQDQRMKSIIMSCLPDDIIESDEKEVFDDEEVTQVKVLMALIDDELTVGKKNHVPKVIVSNKHDVPLTEDIEDPPDVINTERTHEQNVQDDQMITQPTNVPSRNSTEVSRPITEPLVPDVTQSHIPNQASISSYPALHDRWLRDQHIELVNIIGNPGEGMLTRSMASKLTAASASECLFADFLSEIEPKKVFEALKHLGWNDTMQEEPNQIYRNKVWTLIPLPYGKIAIGSNGYSGTRKMSMVQPPKTKQDWLHKPPGFESSKFPNYVYKIEKALYGLKQTPMAWYLKGTPTLGMYYPKCSGFDLKGYSNSDYASCNMDRKRASGAYQILGGKLVCWSVKKQQSVAMSSAEAEYVVAAREFWSTAVAFDAFPSTVEPEKIKKFLIKFSVLNGQRPLTLDFNTFYSSTGLNYNNHKYVDHPTPKDPSKVTDIKLTALMIAVNNQRDSVSPPFLAAKPKKGKSRIVTSTIPKSQGPEASGALSKKSKRPKGNKPSVDMEAQNPTDADLSGTGAKYQEDQTQSSRLRYQSLTGNKSESSYKDQTDKLVEASMSSLEKSSTTINDLYKGMKVITQLLKDITDSVKDDPAINKKIKEASETLAKIFTQTTEILSSQKEASAAWMKSSTNMARNLRSRISCLERAQTHIKSSMSSLQEDTRSIKSMMTDMYNAFRGQSSLAPSSSVTLTFALTNTLANVEGENTTHTATKEPPSHTEGETDANIHNNFEEPKQSTDANIKEGKGIAIDNQAEDQRKLVKALSIVRPDPDELDKEEEIKKAKEEARLNAISKAKVIKVVHEEAKKLGIHLKEAITTKAEEKCSGKRLGDSLSRSYERLRQIPRELRIQSALPAPEQALSQTSGRKQKHMKLELKTRIPGLECNRALPKNVPFVNNMVIEEPEYGIFFTNKFDASMIKSPENVRFSMKLRNLIVEHPDQEKLKSKKVKLEALRYKMD
nr:retrovirus-related Pol polyprotein from transposon TNT 1-94 [Tanacetum cinerariifolium]GEV76571.1 retrovirus-related Pol polyprotein from transposon TNT 1-94 [Tanacetum cinerariifolium]